MLNYVLKPSYEYQVTYLYFTVGLLAKENNVVQTYNEIFFFLKLNRQIHGGFTIPKENPRRRCPSKLWPSKLRCIDLVLCVLLTYEDHARFLTNHPTT